MGDKSKRALYDEKMADPGFRYRTEYRQRQQRGAPGGAQHRGGRRSYAPRKHDTPAPDCELKKSFTAFGLSLSFYLAASKELVGNLTL